MRRLYLDANAIKTMQKVASMLNESERRLRIAKDIAEEYKKIKGIDSIAVGGSTALGTAYSKSDLDIWITYSELPDGEERQKAIRRIIGKYGNEPQPEYVTMGQVDGFRIDGIDISIMLGHNSDLLQIPARRKKVMGTLHEVGISEYQNSIVFYDPNGIWNQAKSELNDYPVDIGGKIINENLDKITAILEGKIINAITIQDEFIYLDAQFNSLEAFLKILFALNQSYYRGLKDLYMIIPNFTNIPENCEARLRKWASENSPNRLQSLILDFLIDIVPLIEDYRGMSNDEKTHQLRRISRIIDNSLSNHK